jgi:hypothetical protein
MAKVGFGLSVRSLKAKVGFGLTGMDWNIGICGVSPLARSMDE